MAKLVIDDVPSTSEDLEDYVAALFQAAGYFVEKNLTERDPVDVLELDVVATNYSSGSPKSLIAEVKGGKWGYSDVFKVLGCMTYLKKPEGVFFTSQSLGKDLGAMSEKLAPWGIKLVCFEDFGDPLDRFQKAGLGNISGMQLVESWRFSYNTERRLIKTLLDAAKSTDRVGPRSALEYHRLVNDGVFFTRSSLEAIVYLYGAFQEHPKLTLSTAHEQSGRDFYDPLNYQNHASVTEAFTKGEHPLLQACMYTEHRARLAILRAGVDICCELVDRLGHRPSEEDWETVDLTGTPASFCNGVRWLAGQPSFHRYALLWQQFLWNWGGFVMTDRFDSEYAWMSSDSGIPIDELPSAMTAFDHFFPVSSSWLANLNGTSLNAVKMVPTYFRGVGCHRRNVIYKWKNVTSNIGLLGFSASIIASWANSSVKFLLS